MHALSNMGTHTNTVTHTHTHLLRTHTHTVGQRSYTHTERVAHARENLKHAIFACKMILFFVIFFWYFLLLYFCRTIRNYLPLPMQCTHTHIVHCGCWLRCCSAAGDGVGAETVAETETETKAKNSKLTKLN